MMTPDVVKGHMGPRGGRNARWKLSPNAPGVHRGGPGDAVRTGLTRGAEASVSVPSVSLSPQYDEVDLRLMDTFPASDAVGRY